MIVGFGSIELASARDRGEAFEAAIRRANVAAGLSCTRGGCQCGLPLAEAPAANGPGEEV